MKPLFSAMQHSFFRKISAVLLLGLLLAMQMPVGQPLLPVTHAAEAWYDAAWMYRIPVTVHNPNNVPLTDYQTRIDLTGADFPFIEALPNGADLRFTDAGSATVYPHWLEKYDQLGQSAWIWVKIPSIPANGDVTLEMYYGNALAPQASDGNTVFSFFDDFDDGNISDWTARLASPGPYFVRGNPIFLEDGRVIIRESANNYGYIKKSFSGSLQGKVVESLLQYGHPSFMNSAMGEDAAPRLTVVNGPSTEIGVGPVSPGGNTPETELASWYDGAGSFDPAPFSYNMGDRVVNRISFMDATHAQLGVRNETDTAWDMEETIPYNAAAVDNGEIALGKLPLEQFSLGGGLGTHQWDWVRVRSYADQEPTFTIGSTQAETLLARLQLSSSMPGRMQTQYTFTVTPNEPIPNGGSLKLTFPSAFNERLSALTASSVQVAAHAQITSITPAINTADNSITLTFASTADITDPISITIGDNAGSAGDIRNPTSSGPHTITLTSYDAAQVQLAASTVQMSTSLWWDDTWLYRTSLHVNNVKVRSALDGYQVQLNLDNTNFDFSHAQANGEDLRFIAADGAALPYWIEYYDQPGQKARVWIKMASVPANTETMVFAYYGNPVATSLSDGHTVFQFFDDFSDGDSSDWSSYSATPGAITTTPGKVQINEAANNNAYLRQAFAGSLDHVALEGVVRYLDQDIGESFHPHIGFHTSNSTYIATGPVRYSAGTLPTDTIRYWVSGTSFDDPGTNYGANEDIDIMLNTAPNYFMIRTKRNQQTTWDVESTKPFNMATLTAPEIEIGKFAYDVQHDLNSGAFARHTWTSLRVRNFVYFEPLTQLGSEETNILPGAPTALFINTQSAGATSTAADPMAFTDGHIALSALFHDDNSLETGTHYDVEVSDAPSFSSVLASNVFQPLIVPLHDGDRSEDLPLPLGLPYNQTLYARLRFYDSLGQISSPSAPVSFRINDAIAPVIDSITPADGATQVPTNAAVTFALHDGESGINSGSLSVSLGGISAITGGVCQTGFSCSITPISDGQQVSVAPTAPYANGTAITVDVTVEDNGGTSQTLHTSFTTVPALVPAAPAPVQVGGSGGGFDAQPIDNSLHGSAPAKPSVPPLPELSIRIPTILLQPLLDAFLPGKQNACSVTSDAFRYTIAPDAPADFVQKVHFLEKFGVNFSRDDMRVLHPDETITRSDMLKYLLQISCADFNRDVSKVPRFPDVPPSHPNDFYILLGRKYHLVNGYLATGLYAPDQFINMAEALKITIHSLVSRGNTVDGTKNIFPKVDYTQWYGPYVRFATDTGILASDADFDPAGIARLDTVVDMMVQAIVVRNQP